MADDDKIWIGQKGEKFGPYSEANVRQWLVEGKLAKDAMAWRSGLAGWIPLATMFPEMTAAEPPPPPFQSQYGQTSPPVARAAATPDLFATRPSVNYASANTERATFPSPPAMHWGLVLLFTVLTFGIFGVVWWFIQANFIRKIDDRSNATLLLVIGLVCLVIGETISISSAASTSSGGLAFVGALLVLAYWIFYLIAYFSMAGSMRRNLPSYGLPVQIGGITLFFFTTYYLQSQFSWIARWKNTGQTVPRPSEGALWSLFLVIPVMSILAAIAIPAYQNYLIRTEVSEAAVLTDGAKISMAEYYSNNGHFPPDNPSAGLPESSLITGKYVSGVDVSGGKITASFDTVNSDSKIRGTSFVLVPVVANGAVAWDCTQSTVPAKYLPSSCRN